MFLSRNKKNNVYPCKSQFYYIKVGLFKGVKIILARFRDVMASTNKSADLGQNVRLRLVLLNAALFCIVE